VKGDKFKTIACLITFVAMKFHALIVIGVVVVCNATSRKRDLSHQQKLSEETLEDRIIKDNTAEIKGLEAKLNTLKKNEKKDEHFSPGSIEGIEQTIHTIEKAKIEYSILELGKQLKTAQQKKEIKKQIETITERLKETPIY
jgi:hypothetical protein